MLSSTSQPRKAGIHSSSSLLYTRPLPQRSHTRARTHNCTNKQPAFFAPVLFENEPAGHRVHTLDPAIPQHIPSVHVPSTKLKQGPPTPRLAPVNDQCPPDELANDPPGHNEHALTPASRLPPHSVKAKTGSPPTTRNTTHLPKYPHPRRTSTHKQSTHLPKPNTTPPDNEGRSCCSLLHTHKSPPQR
jgi:hypothetical protein